MIEWLSHQEEDEGLVIHGRFPCCRFTVLTGKFVFPFWELSLPSLKYHLRVIAKKTIRDFWIKHPDCEQQLKAWYQEAEQAALNGPKDIKRDYPGASILVGDRVVFNIKGNNYRLVVKFNYAYGMMWIRFVGTHAEYDKIDATTI
jgi:mRNA interferase HigB